jgi:hypothetical protein
VGDHFAGNVAADLQTTAGATLNLKNQMSDFNEIIGGALADNLKSIMAVFKALPEGMQTFIVAVVSIGTAIAPLAVSLASVVSLFGAAGLGAALAAAGAAIVPFLPLIAAIGAAVLAVWAVWHYWDDIVAVVKKAVDYMKIYLGDVLPAVFKSVIQSVMDVYNGIKLWLWDKLSALVDSVVKLPGKITAAFGAMYDAVVGHSYVPDLMNSIGRHFGRLDYIMVNPALAAVQNVVGIFSALSDPIKIGQASITGGGAPWGGAAGAGGGTTVNVTVNMSGMLGTDDPQTRSMISSLVSDAVMQGMRNTRLLGTA